MVYEFLAPGFEEIEALIPVDVLRRGGVEVLTVSITDDLTVDSAHGVSIVADTLLTLLSDDDLLEAELLMLPGGMPGASNLSQCERLREALLLREKAGRRMAAICAAPFILGQLGLLEGRRATCYPGFESQLTGAEYTAELCTVDGHITTGEGPAAAFPYAYALLSQLKDQATAEAVAEGMRYKHLMTETGKC